MPGVQEQVVIPRRTEDGRPVGRHRAQAGPAFGLRQVPAPWEQVRDHVPNGIGRVRAEAVGIPRDLGRARHADAVAQTRDRDLVGFVHDRGLRRHRIVRHG